MKFDKQFNCVDDPSLYCKDDRSKLVLKDKSGGKSKYYGVKVSNVSYVVFNVDRGLMSNSSGKQCDYALYSISTNTLRLIELKGSNIEEAFAQILNTFRELIQRRGVKLDTFHARIVTSKTRTPALRGGNHTRLSKLTKEHRGTLMHKNDLIEENID